MNKKLEVGRLYVVREGAWTSATFIRVLSEPVSLGYQYYAVALTWLDLTVKYEVRSEHHIVDAIHWGVDRLQRLESGEHVTVLPAEFFDTLNED